MDSVKQYAQYSELLFTAFEKMKKILPKKYKQTKDQAILAICKYLSLLYIYMYIILEHVKQEIKSEQLSANQYYYIFKKALESQQTKLVEILLDIVQKLIAYEFLDGNCPDIDSYPPGSQSHSSPPSKQHQSNDRRLIDTIVQSICNCTADRDHAVQLQIIRVLLTIVSTFNCKVHGYSLTQIFRSCYQISISSTNNINQHTARASLTQMIHIIFNRMEYYSGNFAIDLHNFQVLNQLSSSQNTVEDQRNILQQLHAQQEMFQNGKQPGFMEYIQNPNSQASSSNLLNVLIRSQDAEKNLRRIWGPIAHYATVSTLSKKLLGLPQAYVGKSSANNFRVSPLDQFTYSICQNMVDNVCLYYARREEINRVFDLRLEEEKKNGTLIDDDFQKEKKVKGEKQNRDQDDDDDDDDDDMQMDTDEFKQQEQNEEGWKESQDDVVQQNKVETGQKENQKSNKDNAVKLSLKSHYKARQRELNNIPLRAVPLTDQQLEHGSYSCAPKSFIDNQKGITSGKSGWCIICRNSSNHFCKETRYPVCDNQCKKKWIQMCKSADDFLDGKEQPMVNQQESVQYLTDAIRIFKNITKLSLREIPKGQMSAVSMRTKILGLQLVLKVVQAPVRTFLARNEFLDIIKQMLREGLMRHAVSSQTTIFERSVSIFFQIFRRFRCSLKQQVAVFLEQIFIRILQSGNSSFHHKQTILQNFEDLVNHSGYIFEIFVNYDCDVESPDIFNRIVECLSKISQGKFARMEHSSLMTTQEEFILRTLSLKILVLIVKNINKAVVDQAKREEQLQHQIEKSYASNEEDSDRRDSTISKGQSSKDLTLDQQLMKQIDASQQEQTKRAGIKKKNSRVIAKDTSDIYEETRQYKVELTKVINKFNTKPSHGVAMLLRFKQANQKPMKKKAQQIASFLKTMPGLSKQQIGLYISEDQPLNKEVMYSFIDLYNFQKISFIDSLRILLSGFRLQGEGQKVDRVMEKFGQKFYKDNPSIFSSAQSAYILAYATIMLQTSIHNPSAKANKMTLKGFKDLVKSVENGKLQLAFLQGIYDSVERQPITSSEDQQNALRQESNTALSFKRKQQIYQKEGQNFAKKGVQIIKTATASGPNIGLQSTTSLTATTNLQSSSNSNLQDLSPKSRQQQKFYQTVRDSAPARPMFLSSWGAMLAVFSVLLEESENKQIVTHCLQGFVYSIKICVHFTLSTQKDAFVQSLVKFTQLYSMRDLKQKNIQCTKMLLHIATHDGDLLKNSWYHVLECISRIDFMHVIGTGGRRDHQFFKKDTGGKNTKRKITDIELQNCQSIVFNIPQQKIDLVFQQSVKLDEESIIDFIESLCRISKGELSSPQYPRFFSLQKIVEVSDFNMSRIRMVWTKIWRSVSEHFQVVGTHSNLQIAKLAVDSLRQLAYRFLDKQELSSYTFQKDFLKPFQVILLHNLHTRSDVKDLIIACAVQMAAMMAKNIKSGWTVLFNIYRLAANDIDENNIKMTLKCFQDLLQNHFKTSIAPNFFQAVACITNLARNRFKREVAIKAIYMLRKFAQRMQELTDVNLNQNPQLFAQKSQQERQIKAKQELNQEVKQNVKPLQSVQITDSQLDQQTLKSKVYTSLWSCLLSSIASFMRDPRQEFQKLSPQMLFQVLTQDILSNEQYDEYSSNLIFWKQIFSKVIIPILDYLVSRVYSLNSSASFAQQGRLMQCLQQQQAKILHNKKCQKNGDTHKMVQINSFVIPFSRLSISTLFAQMTKFFKIALVRFPFIQTFIESAALNTFKLLTVSNIQDISNISTLSMKDFITVAGSQFSQSIWEKVIKFLSQLANTMLPVQLLENSEISSNLLSGYQQKRFIDLPQGSNGDQPMFSSTIPPQILNQNLGPNCQLPKIDFKIDQFRIKATALHMLLMAMNSINDLYFNKIKISDVQILLEDLNKSYTFAGQFNSKLIHRYLIWITGFIKTVQFLPALIKQEKESILYYIIMLNKLYNSTKLNHSEVKTYRNKLFDTLCNFMRQYIYVFKRVNALMSHYNMTKQRLNKFELQKHDVVPLSQQYPFIQLKALDKKIENMNFILNEAILPILSDAKNADLKQNSKVISNLLIELTMADDIKVRERVKDLLINIVNLIQN